MSRFAALISGLAFAAAISLAPFVLSGCGEDSTEQPARPSGHGYVVGIMTGIPQAAFEAVEPEHRQMLIDRGSTFTREVDSTFTWRFPYPDPRISLVFGTLDPVTLNSTDASFSLPKSAMSLTAAPVRLFIEGHEALKPPPIEVVARADGSLETQIRYDFSGAGCTCCKDGPHGAPGREEGVCGSCTACIDNNGISNWGCRTWRWVGFPGSDCNVAWWIYALCGYPNDNYCINGRTCSGLIRHSSCWHSHRL